MGLEWVTAKTLRNTKIVTLETRSGYASSLRGCNNKFEAQSNTVGVGIIIKKSLSSLALIAML